MSTPLEEAAALLRMASDHAKASAAARREPDSNAVNYELGRFDGALQAKPLAAHALAFKAMLPRLYRQRVPHAEFAFDDEGEPLGICPKYLDPSPAATCLCAADAANAEVDAVNAWLDEQADKLGIPEAERHKP